MTAIVHNVCDLDINSCGTTYINNSCYIIDIYNSYCGTDISVSSYSMELDNNCYPTKTASVCCRNRYAEQVMPVMIYTQRKLIERIREHDGQLPPQHHFRAAMASLGGGPITPQQYTTLQLKNIVLKEDLSVVDVLARQIDPEGHDHYQGEHGRS